MSLVIRFAAELVSTEDGGRQSPVFDGYRACMSFGEEIEGVPRVYDAVVVFEGGDKVLPGAAATARAWVLHPELLPEGLAPGTKFELVEGHRTVARVRLLELLDDSTPAPQLRCLSDAKTRPLKAIS